MLADTLIAIADGCAGLSYGDPATRPRYLSHLYGGDSAFNANDMGRKQYGCMLTGRGHLAADETDGMILYHGKQVDILRCPYATYIGQIDEMLQAFAKARGLFVATGDALGDIEPADYLVIGSGGIAPKDAAAKASWLASWGGVAHGIFVTVVDGTSVRTIEGGKRDPKNSGYGTAIGACERTIRPRANGYWLEDGNGDSRRINWRMRCADLPVRAHP